MRASKTKTKATARSDVKVPKKAQNKPKDPNYALYQRWLRSKGFKELKSLAMERDNNSCRCCGRTLEEIEGTKIALQAHHRKYDNVGKGNEEELEDLTILCSVCHRGLHSAASNLRRFTDKHWVEQNIKNNPDMKCNI